MSKTKTLHVSTRLGGEILPVLLDQIQLLQAVTEGTGSAAHRRGAIQGVLAELKTVADALYVLDYEVKDEPVRPGDALIFGRAAL